MLFMFSGDLVLISVSCMTKPGATTLFLTYNVTAESYRGFRKLPKITYCRYTVSIPIPKRNSQDLNGVTGKGLAGLREENFFLV